MSKYLNNVDLTSYLGLFRHPSHTHRIFTETNTHYSRVFIITFNLISSERPGFLSGLASIRKKITPLSKNNVTGVTFSQDTTNKNQKKNRISQRLIFIFMLSSKDIT